MKGERHLEYEKLTFTNNFIFCKVMQNNPDLCKELVELITGRRIQQIVNLNSEQVIEVTPDGRGVRLDVYFEDESTTMYDIEMQVRSNENLPKRSRFYQSMMDSKALEKNDNYLTLMDSYVIFICPFNILPEYGYHVYSFQPRAKENTDIVLDDGTSRIFVCAEGSMDDVSPEMKDFLNYLSGKLSANAMVNKIDNAVKLARLNKKWRKEYMLSRLDIAILEDKIKVMSSELEEKDATIADKDATIADKDATIADKNATIADKDATIADKDATIADKDATIAQLEKEINKLKSKVTNV